VFRRSPSAIPGHYIVGLKDRNGRNAAAHATALANAHGGKVTAVYDSVLHGFAIELPEAAARALARNPKVRFVEDAEGWISSLSWSQTTSGDPEQGLWHLDRSDQRQVDNGGLNGTYGYCATGQGVHAYIVDTGIRAEHAEVAGQVLPGVDFTVAEVGTATNPCSTHREPNGGHGTAVASVLAGQTFGIAKGATLVPVRVIRCNGTTRLTWVLDGLNWINSEMNPNRSAGGVVNMSFWFAPLRADDPNREEHDATLAALPSAMSDLEGAGFAIFVSANNQPDANVGTQQQPDWVQYFDACEMAPSSYSRSGGGKVVTVGGTMLGSDGKRDYRWWAGDGPHQGSSYGGCVDIWAPANGIRVAQYESLSSSGLSSGTSFSSPLVAGLAARWLSRDPSLTPLQLWETIRDGSTVEDSTGQSLIRELKNPGPTASETVPNNRMAYLKDHTGGRCRPLRRNVSITTQPASWTLPTGSQVTLSVETDELAEFQWYRGASGDMSQPVWGANEAAFLIPPLAATTAYWVRAEGEVNAVNSDTATITLGSCPGISSWLSPTSATIMQGESVTLSVSASSTNPLTYEWKVDGSQGWSAIPDSNKTSITVSPSELARYVAVMNNGCRTVGSNTADIFVSKEYTVALATHYWNYVGAEGGGGAGVHAVASTPYQWERFILRDLNGGNLVDGDQVTLRSHSGHYVVAEWCGGPGQTVNANRTAAGDWETFEIRNMDGGYWIGHGSNIALKACLGSGYFVGGRVRRHQRRWPGRR
jgi:hypothetical protein